MFAIFKKEVASYFYSPMAYVLIGVFTLMTALFFLMGNLSYQVADFNPNLSTMGFLLMFVIPILTMRTLAEDRKSGTEVLLLTSPVSLTSIVVGKYLAALLVFIVMTVITFIFPVLLFIFGQPVLAPLVGGYIGFILLGACYLALGVFASSLSENQVITAIVSFVLLLVLWVMEPIGYFMGGVTSQILSWVSLLARYHDFNAGILNLGAVLYFVSFVAVFLFLTIRVIEKRRWSQG